MNKERRKGLPPVPPDARKILTIAQKSALSELESFGWVIDYIRRPLFQEPQLMMFDPKTAKRALIAADGAIEHNPQHIATRETDR